MDSIETKIRYDGKVVIVVAYKFKQQRGLRHDWYVKDEGGAHFAGQTYAHDDTIERHTRLIESVCDAIRLRSLELGEFIKLHVDTRKQEVSDE